MNNLIEKYLTDATRRPRKKGETPEDAAKFWMNTIQNNMAKLNKGVSVLFHKQSKNPKNWTYIGDMERINDMIEEIIDVL